MRRSCVVALVLALAGCGSGAPAVVAPGPTVPIAPISAHVAARFVVPGGPSWMVTTSDGIWVKRDDGVISLLDTATNKVTKNVTLPDGYCQGVGASPGAVWVCSGSDVVRYDLAQQKVTYRWTDHKVTDEGEFPFIDGRIWIGAGDARSIEGVDPAGRGTPVTFPLPVRLTDVGVCDDQLWVLSAGEGRVLRLDPSNGKTLTDTPLEGARALACNGEVWATGTAEAIRLDPKSGRVLARVPLTGGLGVAVGDRSVWIRAATPFLAQIDRATGKEVAAFSAADAPSAGDVVIAAGAVWLCTSEEGVIFRLSDSP